MGAYVSHDCWDRSYIIFQHWRVAIARAAGYHVVQGLNFNRENAMLKLNEEKEPLYGPMILLDWHKITYDNSEGIWNTLPDDILKVLFVHSDCSGYIYPTESGLLADRLEEILPNIDDGYTIPGYPTFTEHAEAFVKGLRKAYRRNERVRFS